MNPLRPLFRLAALLALAATLAGCGTKTPLRLPHPDKPATAGTPAQVPASAPAAPAENTTERQ
jgi:predicted small lipoprotein YifL